MRLALISLLALGACTPVEPSLLELNKTTIDFGTVEVGAGPFRLPLVLTNAGTTATLHFKTPRLDSADEQLSLDMPFDNLEPQERRVASVLYHPTVEGAVSGTLHLDPQDGQGERVVTLTGRAARLAALLQPEQGAACTLDFGTVAAGTDVTRRLTVASTGTAAIVILKAESSIAEAGFRVDGPFSVPIEPGTSADFTVHLDPRVPGALTAQISLLTNSRFQPRLTADACADAQVPLICAAPTEVDLGAVSPTSTASRVLRVESCGNQSVSVETATLSTTSAGFALAMLPLLPRVLAPGEALEFPIDFTATDDLVARAAVRFTSTSPVTPELVVNVGANLPPPCNAKITPSTLTLYALSPLGTVRVTNQGSTDCVLHRTTISPATAPFSLERALVPPMRLAAKQSLEFPIRYTPGSARDGKLELEFDFVRTVTLRGSSSAPPGCRLIPSVRTVSFGGVSPGSYGSTTISLTNQGAGSCLISSVTTTGDALSAYLSTTRLIPQDAATLIISSLPSMQGGGKVIITSNDPAEPTLTLDVLAAHVICDPNCMCGDDEVLAHWRYGTYSSGISPAPENGAIQHSCEPNTCAPHEVLAEVGRGQVECVPKPQDCPTGEDLDWTGAAWQCVTCEVVVQYGGLYDGERVCAPRPNVVCGSGTTPTFEVDRRRWECLPTCNNGQYDRVMLDGQLVCVPC